MGYPGNPFNGSDAGLYQYQAGTGIRVPVRQSVFQGFQVFGPDGMGVAVRALCSVLDYVGIDYDLRSFDDIRAARGF